MTLQEIEIPEQDDLEFRVKSLRQRNPVVVLSSNGSALYIGSGESLQKVVHMLDLVDSSHYILSDFGFTGTRKVNFADCAVTETQQDGFAVASSDSSIGFVMIDQAAEGSLSNLYNNVPVGTVIYFHTIHPLHTWTLRTFKERIGASPMGATRYFLQKQRNASKEDFELAYTVSAVLKHPIHEVPFLEEPEPPLNYVRQIKDALYPQVEAPYGMAIAEAQAELLCMESQCRYRLTESSRGADLMNIETFLARINNDSIPSGFLPQPKYDTEKIVQEASELHATVTGLISRLNATEIAAITLRLRTTRGYLDARPEKNYHHKIKEFFEQCLYSLSRV